jgi:starch-binding outer membrane protein, SusD/RagB family
MKNIKQFLFLATLGLAVGGCNKLVNGYDINPNLPLDAPADQQLTAVELSEGFFMSGEIPRLTGIWTDYFTGADRQYAGLELYNTAAGDYDNAWGTAYTTTLAQARIVGTKAQAVNNLLLLGISQVLESQIIGTTTDLWGDVPYSEALKEDSPGKFDPQASVYAAIQTLLTQAISNLPKNGVSPGARDLFYGGSSAKWIAAAHSLKARYFLHTKNYVQAAAEARLGIASAAGDMLMPYNATTVNGKDANPYYDFITSSRYGYLSAESTGSNPGAGTYAYQLYTTRANAKTDDSKRRDYFFTTKSNIYSVDPNVVDGAFKSNAKAPMVTYFETQAILAESLARTGDAPGALVTLNSLRSYDAASYASGRYTAYVTGDFATGGLLNTATGQTSDQALLKEILTEKYLGMVGQIESFNDLRRTSNLIGIPKKNASSADFPQRLLYPQSEVNTNPNVPQPLPGLFVKTPVNN